MLKFLPWLLVPLLPLVGLVAGQQLKSACHVQLRWQKSFAVNIACHSFINEGKTLLVTEAPEDKVQALVGIDVVSGRRIFYKPMPNELATENRLADAIYSPTKDESKVLLVNWKRSTVILYDWVQEKVIEQYQSGSENGSVNQPVQQHDTIMAIACSSLRNGELVTRMLLWEKNDPIPTVVPIPEHYLYTGLNRQGTLAYYSSFRSPGRSLVLLDVKSKTRVQEIEGGYYEVHWAEDDQSFLAVRCDQHTRGCFVAERFQKTGTTFTLVTGSTIVLGNEKFNAIDNRPFITLVTSVRDQSAREVLVSLFGSMIDECWPDGQVVQLHHEQTGQLLHRLTFPRHFEGTANPFPHSLGNSIALTYPRSIDYWDIHPVAAHYPLLGLLLGLLASVLITWWQLRRSVKAALLMPGIEKGVINRQQ